MTEIPLLVISCDKYADLWRPFFTVFFKQWPDCPYRVHLGSNHLTYPDSRVSPLTIGDDVTWAANVLNMLERLHAEYVILFLEDFLLQRPVDSAAVARLVTLARQQQVGCLRLSTTYELSTDPIPGFSNVAVVPVGNPFRVTSQVAVWKTETLRKLLLPGFNAWEFETIGTQMSEELDDLFWGPFEPAIVYDQFVEKGKWKPEGLAICREAGVEVDLAARRAFTPAELAAHFAAIEPGVRKYEIQRNAVAHFKAGRRLAGLRETHKYLSSQPFAWKLWTIAACGLVGPSAVAWLQKKNLALKTSRARRCA